MKCQSWLELNEIHQSQFLLRFQCFELVIGNLIDRTIKLTNNQVRPQILYMSQTYSVQKLTTELCSNSGDLLSDKLNTQFEGFGRDLAADPGPVTVANTSLEAPDDTPLQPLGIGEIKLMMRKLEHSKAASREDLPTIIYPVGFRVGESNFLYWGFGCWHFVIGVLSRDHYYPISHHPSHTTTNMPINKTGARRLHQPHYWIYSLNILTKMPKTT